MADQRREPEQKRPSPDALLAKAQKEESPAGRLKIFLGAAPGVGKTYAMLTSARARQADGTVRVQFDGRGPEQRQLSERFSQAYERRMGR